VRNDNGIDSGIDVQLSFAKNEHKIIHKIIDKEDLPKYYGMDWKNSELFEIVPGYKHIISLFSEYYKKKLSHKVIVMKEKSTKKLRGAKYCNN